MASPSGGNPAALYRPVLYSAMLSAILTGINTCRTYAYVSSNSDRRVFKGIVILLLLLDLLGSLVIALVLDHNLIGSFGEPIDAARLYSLPRSDQTPVPSTINQTKEYCSYYFLENLGNVIVTIASQGYTAWTIHMMDGRWWPLCVLIFVGVLGELGLGIYIVAQIARVRSLLSISVGSFHLIVGLWNGIASSVDIIATIGLCILLHTVRTPFKSTDHLINRIMFNFINRGVLITIVQILFVALWFAQPVTLNWTPFYFATGKLYLTTLLALLNMRSHTQNKHINMDSFNERQYTLKKRGNSFGQNTNQNDTALAEAPAVHIMKTVEIFHET
ncbi:hypothetical protein K439DRAFT_1657454 [Ramaria rubella]|nr:hypothetical protein K439DRAFT_1657454 [Ramaria rubella]